MHHVPFMYALKAFYTVPMGTRIINSVVFAVVTNTRHLHAIDDYVRHQNHPQIPLRARAKNATRIQNTKYPSATAANLSTHVSVKSKAATMSRRASPSTRHITTEDAMMLLIISCHLPAPPLC